MSRTPRRQVISASDPPHAPSSALCPSRLILSLLHRPGVLIGLIVLATFAALGPLVMADFTLWDDTHTIAANPRLNPPSIENMLWFWDPAHPYMDLYVPVTYTLWSIVAAAGYVAEPDPNGIHLNPWLFHGANLALHAGSAIIAFLLLKTLLRRFRHAAPAAAMGALLFALHPVQVEPVGWASGTKDLLFGFFSLLAIWQYLLFAERSDDLVIRQPHCDAGVSPAFASWRRRDGCPTKVPSRTIVDGPPVFNRPSSYRWIHYGLGIGCFVLAMLSKPTAIVVPLIAGVLGLWPLRRPWWRVALHLLPWLLLTIPIIFQARYAQPVVGHAELVIPLYMRPLIAADALAFYLYKLLFPARLAIDYGRSPHRVLAHGWCYLTWIAPAAVALVAWLRRRRCPWLMASVAVFWIGVLPVLGLAPFDFQFFSTVADHYLYLAMLGPALAMAFALASLDAPGFSPPVASSGSSPQAGLALSHHRPVQERSAGTRDKPSHAIRRAAPWWIGCIVLVLLGTRSWFQTWHWQDSMALFKHAVAVNPHSRAAWPDLGELYYRLHRLPDALYAYEQAEQAAPLEAATHSNLAAALGALGQWDRAQAELNEALRLDPNFAPAHQLMRELHEQRALSYPGTAPTARP